MLNIVNHIHFSYYSSYYIQIIFLLLVLYLTPYNVKVHCNLSVINGLSLVVSEAVRTRLELVTSCVTGRHSNLLN